MTDYGFSYGMMLAQEQMECAICGQIHFVSEMHNCSRCGELFCSECWPTNTAGMCEGCADARHEDVLPKGVDGFEMEGKRDDYTA